MKHIVMEKEAPCLPQEIITNILVRLPVKTLIRFQCVCKYWKNLLKTPSFISEHLRHSSQQNPLLVVDWVISGCNPWRLSLFNRQMQFLEFENPHVIDPSIWGRVYSSDGLLCVELIGPSHHSIWLWNPSIRVVRLLPESLNNHEFDTFSVGFGFSPMVNNYKIVKLFISDGLVVQGEVYALRTGLWRKVELGNLEGVHVTSLRSFTCSGAIFWFGCKVEEGRKSDTDLIISFDIANEVFTLIPFPTLTPAHGSCYNTLTSYENKLAIFSPLGIENSESYRIDLWVLEEYTDPSSERWSWSKIYTSKPNPYRFILCPEIIWRNEIVYTVEALPEHLLIEGEEEDCEEKVAFCNLTTNEFNMLDILIPERQYSPEIFEYVESLVLMEDEAPCLPQEIITNILVRLPVKSLIRFQCVCKYWKNLFKTPSFISEHLHHSTQQNPLLLVDWIVSEDYPCQLCLLNREMQVLEFQNIFDSVTWGRVYSCNGLLCVELNGESQQSFWLWNPSIRVVRPVPKSFNNFEHEGFVVGFGFSPFVNDYKIVKLSLPGYFVVQGEVYSLSTGLWRAVDVKNLEGLYGFTCKPFPCNGALFWIVQKKDEENINSSLELIVSFDIAREVFTLIPIPTVTSSDGCYSTLARYEDKLALFFPIRIENSETYMIDMWVLEECTDPSKERWSWAKIYTSKPNPYRLIIYPVIIWRNEIVCSVEALLEDPIESEEENYEAKVVFCNLNTDEFNMFDIPKRSYSPDIVEYVESLVLLDNIHI